MPFNTALFAVFFIAFFVLYRIVAKSTITRTWLIVIGGALFYAAWDYRFLPLLFGTALLDFFIARAIADSGDQHRKKRLLTTSIVLNLGVLAFFKYTDFLIGTVWSVRGLFAAAGSAPVTGIILPVGISFYTFQSMSYTIDVYRGELAARRHPRDFLAAVSFFPHLVAGPIIRATTLVPQFENIDALSWRKTRLGFLSIGAGLLNKTIADLLAPQAEAIFNSTEPHTVLETWTGVLAFAGQIYGDFSGYTEIAIGVALLLGFTLPANFDLPYIASSPADFWRRWHISLSTWLRDFLFVPLGSSRGGRWYAYRNLMLTMVLGGLWHGASWTFVLWGAYQGLLLVGTSALGPVTRRFPKWFSRIGGIALTFYLVMIGWVLFRSSTFRGALNILRDMHHATVSTAPTRATWTTFALVAATIPACHLISLLPRLRFFSNRGALFMWPLVVVMMILAVVFGGSGNTFIYFQF